MTIDTRQASKIVQCTLFRVACPGCDHMRTNGRIQRCILIIVILIVSRLQAICKWFDVVVNYVLLRQTLICSTARIILLQLIYVIHTSSIILCVLLRVACHIFRYMQRNDQIQRSIYAPYEETKVQFRGAYDAVVTDCPHMINVYRGMLV